MSNNNPQTIDLMQAVEADAEFPPDKVWAVWEVAAMSARPFAASNGNGTPAPPAAQLVSGRYEGLDSAGGEFRLELRVDVDRSTAANIVSGDLFQRSGGPSGGTAVFKHWASFLFPAPLKPEANGFTVTGEAVYVKNAKASTVNVKVPRAPLSAPMPPAEVTFSRTNVVNGVTEVVVEDTFECAYVSPFFRTVEYEVDVVAGTEVLDSHTAELPGMLPRKLKFITPYAYAGVEMRPGGVTNVVPQAGAALPGGDSAKWSDSELHAAMLANFSLLDDAAQQDLTREKQWKLWVLVATRHEHDSMRGMMFDFKEGRQRQGCAVFYEHIKDDKRGALRTYVHEIGHCFNLVHPWEKGHPESLSFMNYVSEYPGGPNAYWNKFAFEFDKGEVRRLRHDFRDNIIMGGNFFGANAAELGKRILDRPLPDDSGLELKLDARKSFVLCEPVVVEVKLYRKGARRKSVHKNIHPDSGFVQLAIRKPSGDVALYRPFATRCVEAKTTELNDGQPSIYASAYIGYGRDGFYFDQAGLYQIVAVYRSPYGAEVVSEPLAVQVRNPLNAVEEEIADLYYGHDQGALFYLLGSDSDRLSSGNRCLENVRHKYPEHPLSVHAHFVNGVNESRPFKTVIARKRLSARGPNSGNSLKLLSKVVDSETGGFFRKVLNLPEGGPQADAVTDADAGGPRLDNITLNMCLRRLARALKSERGKEAANATLDTAVDYFRRKKLRKHVIEFIEDQLAKEKS